MNFSKFLLIIFKIIFITIAVICVNLLTLKPEFFNEKQWTVFVLSVIVANLLIVIELKWND
jgi:purine-cytosine permease-like protein